MGMIRRRLSWKAPLSAPMPASTLHSGWLTSRTTRVILQPGAECPVGRAFAQSMLAEVKVPAAAHDALNCISRQHIVASFCPRSGTCRILVTADGGVRIARFVHCPWFRVVLQGCRHCCLLDSESI